uniref:Cytochrome P450 n=1 Tax=Bionectria ochroleuca TaxID=29856 RepID=A0A8H7N8B9_BIOOC
MSIFQMYGRWPDIVMILFILIFARIAIRCTLYWRMMKREGCQASCKKAYVRDPFIGLDFAYDRLFHGSPARNLKGSLEMYKRLGSTYTVNRLTTQTIYTCDVGNIKHLLATRFDDYKLPAACPEKERLYGLSNILERHIQSMLGQISSQGGSLDLQPLFFSLTMDVATEFLMGCSTNMLNNPDGSAQQFVDDYMVCSTEAARKMTLGPLQFLRFNSAAKQSKARVFKYIDDYIEKCLKRTETGNSTVEQSNLLQELSGAIKDRKMLRDQVLHILLASRDTTASLLSNLFFVLARMPDVYAKLRSEIVAVVGDSVPDFGQLKELQYLRWCINESLRLHPVIPSNAREAAKDTVLPVGGGPEGDSPLFVRRGTIVLYHVYSMHRDPAVYGRDVEEFRPERWNGLRPGWAFLPFSGGPRVCIGQQMALMESYHIVVRLVQAFERLEPTDYQPWRELFALATTCENGVHVKLHKA